MTLKSAERLLLDAGISEGGLLARRVFSELFGFRDYELISGRAECDSADLLPILERLSHGEPIDYILGYRDFYRERYKVTPSVLIPRSDTEMLVDFAVGNIPFGERFLDLCTGSGCVALSTLNNTERTYATLVDISEGALEIARENADALGLSDRCEFLLCDARCEAAGEDFFAVLSNPPYVTSGAYQDLDKNIYYEPKIAFVGGEDGGDFYRDITPLYKSRIKKAGFIAYEIGYDQEELIKSIARENRMSSEIIYDLSGNARVAVLKI